METITVQHMLGGYEVGAIESERDWAYWVLALDEGLSAHELYTLPLAAADERSAAAVKRLFVRDVDEAIEAVDSRTVEITLSDGRRVRVREPLAGDNMHISGTRNLLDERLVLISRVTGESEADLRGWSFEDFLIAWEAVGRFPLPR